MCHQQKQNRDMKLIVTWGHERRDRVAVRKQHRHKFQGQAAIGDDKSTDDSENSSSSGIRPQAENANGICDEHHI